MATGALWTAATLVNESLQDQGESRLHKFIASTLKCKLVAVDHLALIPFTLHGAMALLIFCLEPYVSVAGIMPSNLNFADRTRYSERGDLRLLFWIVTPITLTSWN